MKSAYKWLAIVGLFAAIITLNSCQEDDPKSEEEVRFDKLKGTWNLTKALNGGVERTNEFVNVRITFGGTYTPGGTYSLATNADAMPSDSPWKANESWKFGTYGYHVIILESDPRLVMSSFLNSYAVPELRPKYRELLLEFDLTETERNWQFFFTEEVPD
jgi:hypothetical protein